MSQNSFQWTETGDKQSRAAIPSLNLPTGGKAIINILSRRNITVRIHYVPGIGYFYCFGGSCCERHGLPSVRYVYPILVYGTIQRGNSIEIDKESSAWKIAFLKVADEEYDDIIQKDEIHGGIHNIDLLVKCTEEKYQNYRYEVLSKEVAWRSLNSIKSIIPQELDFFKTHIELSLARYHDENSLAEAIAGLANLNRIGDAGKGAMRPQTVADKKLELADKSGGDTTADIADTDIGADADAGADDDDGVPSKVEDVDYENLFEAK